MARHFTVTLTSGTNIGPYTIYHTSSTNGNQALLYGTTNQATGLTLAQVQGGVLITVPDNATSVIFYNNNATMISDCPTNIVEYPLSPSGTPTPSPTPSSSSVPNASPTPSSSPAPNASPTPSPTPSSSPAPNASPTPSPTPSPSPTPTPTASSTPTPTPSPSSSPTPVPSSTPTMHSWYVSMERVQSVDFCTTNYLASTHILSVSGTHGGMLSNPVYYASDGSLFTGSPAKFRFVSSVQNLGSTDLTPPPYLSIDQNGIVIDVGTVDCNGGENPY